MLQSTFTSKLLNLGNVSSSRSRPGTMCDQLTAGALSGRVSLSLLPAGQQVHAGSLASLCGYLQQRRPLLVSLKAQPAQDLKALPYVSLNSLRINMLVHAWLRVTHTQLGTGDFFTDAAVEGLRLTVTNRRG